MARWLNVGQLHRAPCECSGKSGESCTTGIARCNLRIKFLHAVRDHAGLSTFWDVKPRHVQAYLDAEVPPGGAS